MNTEELERNLRNSTASYPFKASLLVHGVSQAPCPDCPFKREDPPTTFSMKDQSCLKRCPYNIIVWILNEEQEALYEKLRLDKKKKDDLEMAINAHKVAVIEESTRRVGQRSPLLIFLTKQKYDKI